MLELYQSEGCPYCEKVRDRMSELGLSYVAHNPRLPPGDVTNQQTYDEMMAIGGQDQIPSWSTTPAARRATGATTSASTWSTTTAEHGCASA